MAEPKPPRNYRPVDVVLSEYADPTDQEFEAWIPVAKIATAIPVHRTTEVATRIARRLCDGSLLAAAGEKRCVTDDGIIVEHRTVIEPSAWLGVEDLQSGGSSLWEHSEFAIQVRDDIGIGWALINYYDVRIDQDGLFRAFPDLRATLAPSLPSPSYSPRPAGTLDEIAPELASYRNVPENVPPHQSKSVAPAEFDDWYAAQTPEIQAWGGAKLRQKCSKDHGGRHVVKKATDHITKGRKTGRKPGSKNVPRP